MPERLAEREKCTHFARMIRKTISIDNDAYALLKAKKARNESFSDLLKRIVGPPDAQMDAQATLRRIKVLASEYLAANRPPPAKVPGDELPRAKAAKV